MQKNNLLNPHLFWYSAGLGNDQRSLFSWLIVLVFCFLIFPIYAAAETHPPWKGIMFSPVANTNNSHDSFIKDFKVLAYILRSKGINTVVFDMNYRAFHFTCDERLKKFPYPQNRGFTASETRQMAKIARDNGMRVIVAMQVLSHSAGHVFSEVYPEYMLPTGEWREGRLYEEKLDSVVYQGKTYKAKKSHISNIDNAPPIKEYWIGSISSATRNPFSIEGETLIFNMIDELIEAFTVDGIQPDGFHICSDELRDWYDQPELTTGHSSAKIFATVITKVFNHIKENNPAMNVIMWGDMLDEQWNGAPKSPQNTYGRNTAAAVDLIPKGIIVADWRAEANVRIGYDPIKEFFPSINKFADKGFRVWPTSWNEVKGTTDLVWTGNMVQARTKQIVGHLYTTWLSGVVPELVLLLTNPARQVPDSVVTDINESDRSKYKAYYRGVADSINTTIDLVGVQKCRGTDSFCGTYPACEDAFIKSGYLDDEFRAYFCEDNVLKYRVIPFPNDYVAHWKFDGDTKDATGKNDGVLNGGASLIRDAERGSVAKFSGSAASIRVKNNDSLQMGTGGLSISAWFKAGASDKLGTLASKGLTSYALLLHPDGRIVLETNGNDFYRYSANGVSFRDNNWHHVVAIFDSFDPSITLYIDNVLSLSSAPLPEKGRNNKSGNSGLYIGNHGESNQYPLEGYLDDVMIFNRALTRYEVMVLFNAQNPSANN